MPDTPPSSPADPAAPELQVELRGPVAHVRLHRPAKRNALSDSLIVELHEAFAALPAGTRAIVLSGEGAHFCAGLDLGELRDRDVGEGVLHSRMWHAAFDQIQFARAPVVAVLHGAVVGGGLELAAAAHIRVAEASAYYALPEGQRGIFLGGGGSARLSRLIGVARVTDMLLTGRVHDADEGQRIGLSHYLVGEARGLATGFELAGRIAANAPLSNFAVTQVLPRIADQSLADAMLTESLMAAVAQSSPEAKERLRAFLEGRAGKVVKPG